jgi:hypothetical protein
MSLMRICGYAVTYDPYPSYGGPEGGGWMERVDRAALEEAVTRTPRLPLKVGDEVIGQADLSVDDTGLRIEATVNVGYTFRVDDQRWVDDETVALAARRITSMSFDSFSITPSRPED